MRLSNQCIIGLINKQDFAYFELYINYCSKMRKIIKQIAKDNFTYEDGEDIIQEVLIIVYLKIKDLNEYRFFNEWLVKIVKNTTFNFYKQKERFINSTIYYPAQYKTIYNIDYIDEYINNDIGNIIKLHLVNDLSFKEIGIILNKKESAIAKKFYKGINILKSKYHQ